MAFIQSLNIYLLILCLFFGQLLRISFGSLSFPAIDILIVSLASINLISQFQTKPKNKPFFYFILLAHTGLIINYFIYHLPLPLAYLYLLRLTCLLSFIIYPIKIDAWLHRFLVLILYSNVIFGLIQYLFWPDFTYFKALGWDDHLNRLVSTYFDPTFTGLVYLIFLIYLVFQYPQSNLLTNLSKLLVFVCLALTYSRSTFLALGLTSLFWLLKTKRKLYLLIIFLLVITIFILPRPPGEGTHLERTSSIQAKVINYQQGWQTFLRSPLLGVGYNNLPNYFNNHLSHSKGGFDSSLLTILTTTGLFGLGLFLLGLTTFYQQSSFMKQSMLLAILIHAFFANSLLYPFVFVLLILI